MASEYGISIHFVIIHCGIADRGGERVEHFHSLCSHSLWDCGPRWRASTTYTFTLQSFIAGGLRTAVASEYGISIHFAIIHCGIADRGGERVEHLHSLCSHSLRDCGPRWHVISTPSFICTLFTMALRTTIAAEYNIHIYFSSIHYGSADHGCCRLSH